MFGIFYYVPHCYCITKFINVQLSSFKTLLLLLHCKFPLFLFSLFLLFFKIFVIFCIILSHYILISSCFFLCCYYNLFRISVMITLKISFNIVNFSCSKSKGSKQIKLNCLKNNLIKSLEKKINV
jgi:hypothetical protein